MYHNLGNSLVKEQKLEAAIQEKERVHSLKKSGSWKKRRSLNGTEEE